MECASDNRSYHPLPLVFDHTSPDPLQATQMAQPVQPLNLAPLFEALHVPPPLVIPPLPLLFDALLAAHAPLAGGFAVADDIDYDATTVPVDIDEYYEFYEMAAIVADDLPGTLVNAVQEARPALDLVRSRGDVSNLLKNRFYYTMKRLFLLFIGSPENLDGWRNMYEAEVNDVLPHLPAEVIGDLAARLEAFQGAFQPAVDEMLGLRQADGSYSGYPDLLNDLHFYVRRMLRMQDPLLEEDAHVLIDAEEEDLPAAQVMPLGHPQLLPNGGDYLPEVEEADLPYHEDHQEDDEPP